MKIERAMFGKTPEGRTIEKFTISNANGISFSVIQFGAALTSFRMPDNQGTIDEITLGYDTLDEYMQNKPFFGVTVGRVANRIGGAKFSIGRKTFSLFKNDGENHLHGGKRNFSNAVWDAEPFSDGTRAGVAFTYLSRDGEENYPGNLSVKTVYSLSDMNEFLIEYSATTDAETPVNLTNHAYWNLQGAGSGTVFDHILTLKASRYLPVDSSLIPTGAIEDVAGTPMDFRSGKAIKADFEKIENGYDHCFIIDDRDKTSVPSAELYEPKTGRGMKIYQSQPGIQLYTSNFLGKTLGAGNRSFDRFGALCLETEGYPDAVNQSRFPSVLLKPGETYREWTKHVFFSE